MTKREADPIQVSMKSVEWQRAQAADLRTEPWYLVNVYAADVPTTRPFRNGD